MICPFLTPVFVKGPVRAGRSGRAGGGRLPDTTYDAGENPARCDLQVDGDRPDPVNYQRIAVMPDSGLRDAYAQCDFVKSLDCSQWTVGEVDGYPTIRANGEHVRVDPDADGPGCDRAEKSAADVLAALG